MYTRILPVASLLLVLCACSPESTPPTSPTQGEIAAAARVIGLEYTPLELTQMQGDVAEFREDYRALRELDYPNSLAPALIFEPGFMALRPTFEAVAWSKPEVDLQQDRSGLAFYSVAQLASLIQSGQLTSLELTEFFLERLQRFDPVLHLVVTRLDERAREQARRADAEIAAGNYRGPLHGIPWLAKDLLALEGEPTTWGAVPFRDQVIDDTATVIRKLDEAGAVLLAKVSLGALAWGDVWFGGKTRNPWNTEQGSSGSSAGSAAGVSAGLAPFAIGSETWGSIVSPATRVGVSGLRPTFGRVSRHGAMALSWSMDKIGPLCRNAEDCALVFDVIHGLDPEDPTTRSAPFQYQPFENLAGLRIGYLHEDFAKDYDAAGNDRAALDTLRDLGAELIPIALPDLPIESMAFVLSAEAAAAFDELTRSNRDDLLTRQVKRAWPNVFRAARLIPAVEYIQANRLRRVLIARLQTTLQELDLYVAPSLAGDNLLATNLTGHPAVVVPNGFNADGSPTSITFIGKPFDEGRILAVADAYQRVTGHDEHHPPGFD